MRCVLEEEKRILSLDVGDGRIGVAVSDPLFLFGEPVAVLKRDGNEISEIKKFIETFNPFLIVIGLPKNLKGEVGPQAEKVLDFVEELRRQISLREIVLWDERYTSVIAHQIFRNLNIHGKQERKIKDSMEAVVILESYMNYYRRKERKET